ncbi:hypothetical protein [uncultured Thiothrix sp.]|jgi:uncharacterized repeat protein (TIGR01451 family)|uniref:hypothetical protein n=1 Tax=uncultured Thiothrix sp. TaxID=223185 RepID=UPI00262DCDD5|nr:hypothetical protein [uncultured Thiothrix sp.]HMT91649.1 hypothetical protein [Thiolinea sp.]
MLNRKYCCLGLFLLSYQVVAQPQVELTLTQWLDPNCQGIGLVEATRAEPSQCIRYQVQIKNSGSSVAQAIKLELPIPTHTILKQGSVSNGLNQAVVNNKSPLQTEIDQLEVNESISLYYTVQVL